MNAGMLCRANSMMREREEREKERENGNLYMLLPFIH